MSMDQGKNAEAPQSPTQKEMLSAANIAVFSQVLLTRLGVPVQCAAASV